MWPMLSESISTVSTILQLFPTLLPFSAISHCPFLMNNDVN